MRVIEIVADPGSMDTLVSIAQQHGALDHWYTPVDEGAREAMRILVAPDKAQAVIDAAENLLSGTQHYRIVILPVEATLPKPQESEDAAARKASSAATTREELYQKIEQGARWGTTFFLMVVFSTVVAAIGLIEDNVAVVIGAMVIAPLLGPNLALAFGSSLGDTDLVWQSLKTNALGIGVTLSIAAAIGMIWPVNFASGEILLRTDVGLDGVALALASGAAAVLSLTSGVSTVLVGVMVAVALLPPATTLGMTLGSGQYQLATGAGLLLAVNIVCVNLAAKLVFLAKGVKPRTWLEKRKARQSMPFYIGSWISLLVILLGAIYLRSEWGLE